MITYENLMQDIAEMIYVEILKEDKNEADKYADDLNQEAFLAYYEVASTFGDNWPANAKEIILDGIRSKLNDFMVKFGYANFIPSGLIKPKDNVAVEYEDSIIDAIDEDNANKKRV